MAWHELFDAFHRRIRLDKDSGELLREKREILLRKVQAASPVQLDWFNQGSYAMATGLLPYPGKEQDIDLGLVFPLDIREAESSLPKSWVYSALRDHTKRGVEWRRHCVTVYYAESLRAPGFHVDLAVYGLDSRGGLHLAVGRQKSREDNRRWMRSDPKALVNLVTGHLRGDAQAQFRRVVRYLKRWRDHRWGASGAGAPPGIALTVLALEHFEYMPGEDRLALLSVVDAVLASAWWGRVRARLPVEPGNDTLEGLSDPQMDTFKSRLGALKTALERAGEQTRATATRSLAAQFGDEFAGGSG